MGGERKGRLGGQREGVCHLGCRLMSHPTRVYVLQAECIGSQAFKRRAGAAHPALRLMWCSYYCVLLCSLNAAGCLPPCLLPRLGTGCMHMYKHTHTLTHAHTACAHVMLLVSRLPMDRLSALMVPSRCLSTLKMPWPSTLIVAPSPGE